MSPVQKTKEQNRTNKPKQSNNQTRKTKLNKKRKWGRRHTFFHGTVNSQPMDSRDPFNLRTGDIRTVLCHFRKQGHLRNRSALCSL